MESFDPERRAPVDQVPAGTDLLTGKPSPPSPSERVGALLEVILCTDVLAFLIAALPFLILGISHDQLLTVPRYTCVLLLLESAIILAQIYALLRLRGQGWSELGWPRKVSRELAIGVLFVPACFACTIVLALLIRRFWPEIASDKNLLLESITSRSDLVFFLIAGVLAGGVKEEVQRAFVLRRFDRYLGNVYIGWILWSIYFGLGHQLQGKDNALGAGLLGLLFGGLYLARGNFIATVVAHGLFNTITLIGYWNLR